MKKGFVFSNYQEEHKTPFEKLLEIFMELITHTSGDFEEAIEWLRQLDEEYQISGEDYSVDQFIEDLKNKGYIREEVRPGGASAATLTHKTERAIRQHALEQIFGKLRKTRPGDHFTRKVGSGDEHTGEYRGYSY